MSLAMIALHVAMLAVAGILLVAAAISDANRYRIPNAICAALVIFFPLYVATSPRAIEWEQNAMVAVLLLLSGLAMFFGNLAGAGDVKLLAAMGLWAGPHLLAVFIVTTAVAGGALALVMAGLTLFRNHTREQKLPVGRVPIPYGIAIATGGLIVVYKLVLPILSIS